ncbi:MAG: DNA polymerase III subunit beta, partial [Tannerella sp.]|nr:DNA polymerase III subunit beta [Tannerella sp.]
DINDENMEIFIYFENGKYNFIGQKGDTYPQQKALEETDASITLESQVLLNGIGRALFAAAEDELRPVMNGVYFDIQTDSLTFAASDGHKLMRLCNSAVRSEGRASFILPKKPANLLKNLLPKSDDPVKIQFDENNAYVTAESYEMVCRLIEGRYPNYNSVIPQNNPNRVTIERLPLLNALERVSVFSNPASSLVKLQLTENRIVVSAQDIDFSTSAEEKIFCQYEGEELSIGFKATFLIEILDNISANEIVLALADPSRAGVIMPVENEENEDLLMLLMPMVLND